MHTHHHLGSTVLRLGLLVALAAAPVAVLSQNTAGDAGSTQGIGIGVGLDAGTPIGPASTDIDGAGRLGGSASGTFDTDSTTMDPARNNDRLPDVNRDVGPSINNGSSDNTTVGPVSNGEGASATDVPPRANAGASPGKARNRGNTRRTTRSGNMTNGSSGAGTTTGR